MQRNEILVVDDHSGGRAVLKKVLETAGYTVTSVVTAERALQVLRERTIRVMFIDIDLPGMSGLDLCREVRKDDPIALIFAMTGYVALYELSDCREIGFDDYFAKPVSMKSILTAACGAFEKLDRWVREGSLLETFPCNKLLSPVDPKHANSSCCA
jgi:CheY-like chemotaxis protein